MITAEDLKPPPVEYWVNVYEHGKHMIYGMRYNSREAAIIYGDRFASVPLIYRIHVRLK